MQLKYGFKQRLEPLFDGRQPLQTLFLEKCFEIAAVKQLSDKDHFIYLFVKPAIYQFTQPWIVHILP